MANSITTTYARGQLAKARAGDGTVTRITHMAFGSGGVDGQGQPKPPQPDEAGLYAEIYRKPVNGHTYPSATVCRYTCTLLESEMVDQVINEIALFDEANKMVCKKTFRNKVKDGDMKMTFELDDIY